MADTRITCQICTVISSRARPDLVVKWLACQTLEPEDQVRFAGGYLSYIVFFFFFFSVIKIVSGYDQEIPQL